MLKTFLQGTGERLRHNLGLPVPTPEARRLNRIWKQLDSRKLLRKSLDFSVQHQGYVLEYHLTDSRIIVVTFEHGGFEKNNTQLREPWGVGLLRRRGLSYIGVKLSGNHWFLDPDLRDVLPQMRAICDEYDEVVTYGASMGGFAALTYANALGADKVIAFCPQSSRDPERCPWEGPPRPDMKGMDWSSPYADAVGNFSRAREVHVFADRYFPRDRQHLARLEGENLRVWNLPYIGHSVSLYLQALKLLQPLLLDILSDQFCPKAFRHQFRDRRKLKKYASEMRAKTANYPSRRAIVEQYLADSPMLGPN